MVGLDHVARWPGSNAESDGTNAQRTQATGGVPRRGGIEIHIRVALDMWFCDHSEWWVVWLLDSTLGGGFGLVGG